MVPLDDVEAHGARVLGDAQDHRPERFELIDVVAVRLGGAAGRPAGLVPLQPHHLRLAAVPQAQAMRALELIVKNAQVAAAVGREMGARIVGFFTVAEARAEHARDPLVPRQLHERLGIGNADELGGLGPVADVLFVTIHEQVGGRAVDQLKTALADRLPVVGGDTLAHDAASDRDELIVDVLDAELVDLGAHLLDDVAAALDADVCFQCRHCSCIHHVGESTHLAIHPRRKGVGCTARCQAGRTRASRSAEVTAQDRAGSRQIPRGQEWRRGRRFLQGAGGIHCCSRDLKPLWSPGEDAA